MVWGKEQASQKDENRVDKERKTTGVKPTYSCCWDLDVGLGPAQSFGPILCSESSGPTVLPVLTSVRFFL